MLRAADPHAAAAAEHGVLPSDATRELEARAGVFSGADLDAEFDHLSQQHAPLAARYGANGTAKELRENYYAALATEHRTKLHQQLPKVTEPMVEEAVRTDRRWAAWLQQEEDSRAEYLLADNRLDALRERRQWGLALIRFAASEAYLQPRVQPG